ncbi:hypothetical protein Ancab_012458, partial [Ancistrocladus abbreviatus]
CPIAFKAWMLHARWWKMATVFEKDWRRLLWLTGNINPRSSFKLWLVTSATLAWCLWKERMI